MEENVDKELLTQAVNDVMPRYLAYKVRLRKGFLWHFLEENTEEVKVFDIDNRMLRPIDPKQTNGYLFRLSCAGKTIRLEIAHVLTDGNGTLDFLKTIVMRYRQLQGQSFENVEDIVDWQGESSEGEIEDSFLKHYKPVKLREMHLKELAGGVPHRIAGTLLKDGYQKSVGIALTASILEKAKQMGASFTAYVTGVIAYTIEKISKSEKPVVVMVPVNLRKIYPSVTMRNFVTFVRIVIKPNSCKTLAEFVEEAKVQLNEKASKDKMDAFISTTVRAQKNVIFKCLPLFVKTFLIKFGRLFMRSRQTIIYSNLGLVKLPSQMGVDRFEFVTNVSKNNTQNLGSITVGQKTCFLFTRAIRETSLPDTFFSALREQGIEVLENDTTNTLNTNMQA